jgi:hypothetical protein
VYVNESGLSEMVKSLEPEACTDGQDKDESVMLGVTFLEKVDPCLLADPFVVSVWVKTKLGAVESVKIPEVVLCVCVSTGQREQALCA